LVYICNLTDIKVLGRWQVQKGRTVECVSLSSECDMNFQNRKPGKSILIEFVQYEESATNWLGDASRQTVYV